jgi:hypothetical protein
MERMLRPQGIFQSQLPVPAEWQQQAYQPAPGGYQPPGGGQYPQPDAYQQGAPLPPALPPAGGQYPQGDGYQQAGPPESWGAAPTGVIPAGAMPTSSQPMAPGQPGLGYGPGAGYAPGAGFGPGEQPTQAVGFQEPFADGQLSGGQVPANQLPGLEFGVPEDAMPRVTGADRAAAAGQRKFGLPRNRKVLVGGGAALVVIVVAAVVLSSHGGGSPQPTAGGGTGGTTAGTAGTPTATTSAATAAGSGAPVSAQTKTAATALNGLLATSGSDRMKVSAADANVEACGQNIAADEQVFSTAATNRRTLLTELGQLPDRTALTPAMITDLTNAWQASVTVDTDLTKWAQDEAANCNKATVKNDPNFKASIPVDSQATNFKTAFVALWNPVAAKDGLPPRKPGDI